MINFSRGISIAQLLIVVAIIVVISFVSFPALSGYIKDLELKNSTKEVILNLKLTQQLAVTEQVRHSLLFSPLDSSYYLIKKTEPATTLESFYLAPSVYFATISGFENNEVVYNSAGAVDLSGDIYLSHLNTQNQTLINVKPSGYVNWQTYQSP